ncbi:MAG: ABC transporter ATP-binding protein [Halobacteria archaeon]
MSDAVLEAREVTKVYTLGKERVRALDGVSLRVARGEFLGVFGASGSGKSTLLNMLGALDRPTSGDVLVEGENVARLRDAALSRIRRERIGFVFQTFHLLANLTALENVMAPLLPVAREATLRTRAEELLRRVGLGERLRHRPFELSGGQRQRVAVARALVNRPRFILADEPTGNLDSKTGEEILDLFQALNREGQTLVVVSHNPALADRCHRSVELLDGRIAGS